MQYMYKCCAVYVFNRVELTCQMILDKGCGFLHLLDDIATKDCFRGRALGPVVQRWISANPGLKFTPLF